MAEMIPDLSPESITNNGERLFYGAAAQLPDDYTVLYSYKFRSEDDEFDSIREADFIIVHPSFGYVVVEVKQGDVSFNNGIWYEYKNGSYQPMRDNPEEQAIRAMYAVLDAYKRETGQAYFPLAIRYALCFPECGHITGSLPQTLKEGGIWTFRDLDNLAERIAELFAGRAVERNDKAAKILIEKVLAPSFTVFSTLEDKIKMFNLTAERILTEEQNRILDETEEDRQKIFYGAAGTGKTFVAMEKARRLARQGNRVLLTCFNKNLLHLFKKHCSMPGITAKNFHDFVLGTLRAEGVFTGDVPQDEIDRFFRHDLPELGMEYFLSLPEERKFDGIIIDEGQDFYEEWLLCLEAALKENGYFYIFVDPNQNIFGVDSQALKKYPVSKHRLTVNLRNTEQINNLMGSLIGKKTPRVKLVGGLPVAFFAWNDADEEKRLIQREAGRLVSQGLRPERITILSPHRKSNSSLAGVEKIREWPLISLEDTGQNGIRFATVRSYKGLEADVVFLIGVIEGSPACTIEDIYVGISRARYLLYIFHHKDWHFPEDRSPGHESGGR